MPAINPVRLKIQAVELAETWQDRGAFVRALHHLLEFYADRVRRPGQAGKPKPLIRAYHAPKQVLRQIETELFPHLESDWQNASALADLLWEEAWLETRLLAIGILGQLPTRLSKEILQRMHAWGIACREGLLLDALLAAGVIRFWQAAPQEYAAVLEAWLTAPELATKRVGLRAILPLLTSSSFDNLPLIFRQLTPLLREPERALEADLIITLRALAQHSPRETIYYLQETILTTPQAGIQRIVRQSLSALPEPLALALRERLRASNSD